MNRIKLAITGGIGSGKSVVSHLLEIMGIPVYDCDKRAKELMANNSHIRHTLVRYFGEDCYHEDGTLNKKWLASRIFIDKDAIRRVNELVHPCVKKDFLQWAETQKSEIAAVETAILYESGMRDAVDKVLLVWADAETCISRIERRNGMSRNQIQNRMNNQMSVDELLLLSDYSVCNDGETAIIPEVAAIVNTLKKSQTLFSQNFVKPN